MEKFEKIILTNMLQRLSFNKSRNLIERFKDDIIKLPLIEGNQILNLLESKASRKKNIQENQMMECMITINILANEGANSPIIFDAINAFNNFNPTVILESLEYCEERDILSIIENHHVKDHILQTLIVNLSYENQLRIVKLKRKTLQNSEINVFLNFLASISFYSQKYIIENYKEIFEKMNSSEFSQSIYSLYKDNMRTFLKRNKNTINRFDISEFIKVIHAVDNKTMDFLITDFSQKLNEISGDALFLLFESSVKKEGLTYQYFKNNNEKLFDASDNIFSILVSRLNDSERLESLEHFQKRYDTMYTSKMLDLFENDNDEIKLKMFYDYKGKIETIKSKKFIKFLSEKISDSKKQIDIIELYQEKVNAFNDEEFISFITSFYDRAGYGYCDSSEEEQSKKDVLEEIILRFEERIQNIDYKNIPTLFNKIKTGGLQEELIPILEETLIQSFSNMEDLNSLLNSLWGKGIDVFYEQMEKQFRTLTASEWFEIVNSVELQKLNDSEKIISNCDIEDFSFISDFNFNNKEEKLIRVLEKSIFDNLELKWLCLDDATDIVEIYNTMKFSMESNIPFVFDSKTLEILSLTKYLLQNKKIDKNNQKYLELRKKFYERYISDKEVENSDNKERVSGFFFNRVLNNKISIVDLHKITKLKEFIYLDRNVDTIKNIKYITEFLSENQVVNYNRKNIMTLYKLFGEDKIVPEKLIITFKLNFVLGFTNANKIIKEQMSNEDIQFQKLEFLFDDVNIKAAKLDENGNPLVDNSFCNFIMGNGLKQNESNITKLLYGKSSEFEKNFSFIANNWNILSSKLNGSITVPRILEYLSQNKVLLNPDEYKLEEVISEFGNNWKVIEEAREIYNDMRNRKNATIPKISGVENEYQYESLDLDDPLALVVGEITRCCYRINGMARKSLNHAVKNVDGRTFVVRRKGKIVAHSWMWRNGNVLCFDNVETMGDYNREELLEVYRNAAKELVVKSKEKEIPKTQIKIVTFGAQYSRIAKPKSTLKVTPLPIPRGDEIYSDAGDCQYILVNTGDDDLYFGEVEPVYKKERKNVTAFLNDNTLSTEEKQSYEKEMMSIVYEEESDIKNIDIEDYYYVLMGEDWYLSIEQTGEINLSISDKENKESVVEMKENISKLVSSIKNNKIELNVEEESLSNIVKKKVL